MKVFGRINDLISKIYSVAIGVILGAMVIVVFIQIVMRYVFGASFVWTEEMPRFLLVWMVYLGTAVVTKEDGNISITILESLVKGEKGKIVLKAFQHSFLIIYSVFLIIFSVETLRLQSSIVSQSMRIPMNCVYVAFPIAAAAIAIHSIFLLIRLFERKEAA